MNQVAHRRLEYHIQIQHDKFAKVYIKTEVKFAAKRHFCNISK